MFSLTELDRIWRTHPKREEGGSYSIPGQHMNNSSLFLFCSNTNSRYSHAPFPIWAKLCWGGAIVGLCLSPPTSLWVQTQSHSNHRSVWLPLMPLQKLTSHSSAQVLVFLGMDSGELWTWICMARWQNTQRESVFKNPNNNEHSE